MYEVLTSGQFYKQYQNDLVPGEFKFITKAYRQSDNTIAIFKSENNVDCYFQLPGYKSLLVPENRCSIYRLKKGYIDENPHIPMDDERYKIPVGELELWNNPYVNEVEFPDDKVPEVVEKKEEDVPKESIFKRVERLTREAYERADKLEESIKKMQEMEDKILETLSKLEYED